MTSPGLRRPGTVLLSGLLLAACGTTVPQGSLTAAPTTLTTQPAGSLAAPQALDGTQPQSAGPGAGPARAVASEGAGSGSAAARTPSLVVSGPDGPGVTATTITIGITFYQSAKAANDAVGASNIDTGDPVAAAHALIAAINRMGGIAVRTVKAVTYSVDPQSTQPYAAAAQALCSYFTQDVKVLAVINGTPAADASACLGRKGVAVLSGSLLPSHVAPNEIAPYSLTMARGYAALVPELAAQGWFGGWDRLQAKAGPARAKTGVVTTSDPLTTRVIDGVLLPALRAAGHAPDPSDVIRLTPPGGFADDGALVASIQSAVLKLNADGVDHVILDDSNGSLSLLFHNYAYSQGYFPGTAAPAAPGGRPCSPPATSRRRRCTARSASGGSRCSTCPTTARTVPTRTRPDAGASRSSAPPASRTPTPPPRRGRPRPATSLWCSLPPSAAGPAPSTCRPCWPGSPP